MLNAPLQVNSYCKRTLCSSTNNEAFEYVLQTSNLWSYSKECLQSMMGQDAQECNSSTPIFFIEYAGELRIFVLQRGNNGPYTIPAHPRTIHENIGHTLQHNYLKKTFNDQTTRKRLTQNHLPYLVRELEVS